MTTHVARGLPMGFVIEAKCTACDYQSNLTIGNSRNIVFICSSCKSVVNPERIPFRYDLPPCPQCGARLNGSELVDSRHLPIDPEGKTASNYKCPRCDDGRLAFRNLMHFSMRVQEVCPEPNAIVHGKFSGGKLDLPGMWLRRGTVKVENPPESTSDQPMELLVTNVEKESEVVSRVTLRFVRFLDSDSDGI